MLQSSGVFPVDSFSFPLVDFTRCFKLHRKRDNVVVIFSVITGPDDLLPAHWAFGDAFSRLRTLIFSSYQGFHETGMAEQVTLERADLVSVRETVEGNDVPQWVAVRSFMFSMQIMHCNVDSFTGLLACSFCALMVAIRCCSRTFDKPASSSTSCENFSNVSFRMGSQNRLGGSQLCTRSIASDYACLYVL